MQRNHAETAARLTRLEQRADDLLFDAMVDYLSAHPAARGALHNYMEQIGRHDFPDVPIEDLAPLAPEAWAAYQAAVRTPPPRPEPVDDPEPPPLDAVPDLDLTTTIEPDTPPTLGWKIRPTVDPFDPFEHLNMIHPPDDRE